MKPARTRAERPQPPAPPRRSAVGRADLLLLLDSLGPEHASVIGDLTGLRHDPPEPPAATPAPAPQPSTASPAPTPPAAQNSRREPLPARHIAVVAIADAPPDDIEVADPDDAQPLSLDDLNRLGPEAPATRALSPPRRMANFLRRTLRRPTRGNELDLARLVGQMARVKLSPVLPRRPRWRWDGGGALIIDASREVQPLWPDLLALADHARQVSGRRAPVYWRNGEGDWFRRADSAARPWRPVPERTALHAPHWLVAGDAGSHARDPAQAEAWAQRHRRAAACGGSVTVLAPVATPRARPAWTHDARVVPWDLGQRLVAVRPQGRADDAAEPQAPAAPQGLAMPPSASPPAPPPAPLIESPSAPVRRLLALMAMAVRIEPGLLRAIRLLAGLTVDDELAAWNHADVVRSAQGCMVHPDRVAQHREAVRGEALALRKAVAHAIQAHHGHLFVGIRMEEAALAQDLAGEAMAELPNWSQACETLARHPGSTAAEALARYVGRTGERAHERLWRSVPALADSWVEGHRGALLNGQAAVPAGLPASVVARRLVQGNRSGDDSELYTLYQFGDRLVLRNEAPPMSRAYSLLADFQVDGGCLVSEGDGGPARWVTVEQATESLASLNGPGPWVLQSSRRTIWIERVAAPKSTLEWSRNRSGLWARVPWPTGTMDLRQIAEPVVPGKRHWQGADRFEIPIFAPGLSDAGFDRFGLFVSWRFYSVEQCFRYIEPGTFLMGSPEAEPERDTDEGPQHEVTLTQGFWLADTACTQALWTAVMGSNPSHFTESGDQCPVEQVSWDDVREFLSRIQKLLPGGCEAVMPTEAEWEYACRAGTPTPFSFGELIDPTIVNYDGNFPYAGGEKGEYREKTVPVNSLAPNPWGLYEMHGNVYEWCADHLGAYSAEPQIDPRGADRLGALRAIRGGSWIDVARGARSAYRGALGPGLRLHYLGFRFALRSQEPGRGAQQQGLAAETRRGSPVSAAEPPPGARALPAEPVELPLSAAEPPEFFERPEPEPDPAPGLLDRLKSLTRRRPKTPPKGKR